MFSLRFVWVAQKNRKKLHFLVKTSIYVFRRPKFRQLMKNFQLFYFSKFPLMHKVKLSNKQEAANLNEWLQFLFRRQYLMHWE